MSLNGLDAPAIQEASEYASQGEPGRWFLLKYCSRDDVELLGKGDGGTAEMRAVLANEPDDSPLYGFIRYRRRNVLLKIIPEGASRVVKARTQVHFQLVSERFSVHDNVVNITQITELTDSFLSTACSTHSSNGSISSCSSSLRNRRLEDIAESAEEASGDEEKDANKKQATLSSIGIGKASNKRPRSPLAQEVILSGNEGEDNAKPIAQEPSQEVPLSSSSNNNILNPPRESLELRRSSTSGSRPVIEDQFAYLFKPKVKVGPRPVQESKRPRTSGSDADHPKVASVPKSVHLNTGKSAKAKAKQYQHQNADQENPTPSLSHPPVPATHHNKELPPLPLTPVVQNICPPAKLADIPSPLLSPTPSLSFTPSPNRPLSSSSRSSTGGLSPEKQKLMRALQLRRRTMQQIPPKTPTEEKVETESNRESGLKSITEQTVFDIKVTTAEGEVVKAEIEKVSSPTSESEDMGEGLDDKVPPMEEVGSAKEKDEPSTEDDEEVKDENKDIAKDIDVSVEGKCEGIKADEKPQVSPVSTNMDESEGKKVQGLESDVDSDNESEHAEIAVAEQQPITPLRTEFAPTPGSVHTSPQSIPVRTVNISSSPDRAEAQPTVLKRLDREKANNNETPAEIPVVETARSVSAPFLRNARQSMASAPIVKKVNVPSGGSVSQRIRQFQALASQPPAPNTTPPKSANKATPPPFSLRTSNFAQSSNVETERVPSRNGDRPQLVQARKFSFSNTAPFQSFQPNMPPPSIAHSNSTAELKTISSSDNKRATPSLQVTTKIVREPSPVQRPSTAAISVNGPRRPSVDFAAFASANTHRRSVDYGKTVTTATVSPIETPTSNLAFFGKSPSPTSPTEPKKQAKEEKRRSRSSTTEKRSPIMPLLRRMSSAVSGRTSKDKATPVVSASTEQNPVKSFSLTAWVNVQLPDTMLWRRRCMKVDSNGWLYLAVTDDETAPQTKKYHIPTEARQAKIPDLDEQELPFSVVVMLEEGGLLQCACQDSREQKEVLGAIKGFIA